MDQTCPHCDIKFWLKKKIIKATRHLQCLRCAILMIKSIYYLYLNPHPIYCIYIFHQLLMQIHFVKISEYIIIFLFAPHLMQISIKNFKDVVSLISEFMAKFIIVLVYYCQKKIICPCLLNCTYTILCMKIKINKTSCSSWIKIFYNICKIC